MLLQFIEIGVPVVAFLLMLAVGLDVTPEAARRLTDRRATILSATLAQVVLLPAAGLAVTGLVPSAPAEYLLLIAACPGGGMSNVYVYLARANTALSVILTAASCMAAVLTMPGVFVAYAGLSGQRLGFELPIATLLGQLVIMTVIPVAAGAYLRLRFPAVEAHYGPTLRLWSTIGVVAVVLAGLIQSGPALPETIRAAAPAVALLLLFGMAAGWTVGAVSRAPAGDRFTLLVEFAVRNLAIAMVIEVTLLGHPDFVAFGAVALLVQAAVLLIGGRLYRSSLAGRRVPPAPVG